METQLRNYSPALWFSFTALRLTALVLYLGLLVREITIEVEFVRRRPAEEPLVSGDGPEACRLPEKEPEVVQDFCRITGDRRSAKEIFGQAEEVKEEEKYKADKVMMGNKEEVMKSGEKEEECVAEKVEIEAREETKEKLMESGEEVKEKIMKSGEKEEECVAEKVEIEAREETKEKVMESGEEVKEKIMKSGEKEEECVAEKVEIEAREETKEKVMESGEETNEEGFEAEEAEMEVREEAKEYEFEDEEEEMEVGEEVKFQCEGLEMEDGRETEDVTSFEEREDEEEEEIIYEVGDKEEEEMTVAEEDGTREEANEDDGEQMHLDGRELEGDAKKLLQTVSDKIVPVILKSTSKGGKGKKGTLRKVQADAPQGIGLPEFPESTDEVLQLAKELVNLPPEKLRKFAIGKKQLRDLVKGERKTKAKSKTKSRN